MIATPGPVLRPLGIGEILDRAVNLCVRNFLPLAVIYIVFIVPFSFVQYYATKNLTALIQALATASKASPSDPKQIFHVLGHQPTTNPFVLLLTFALYVISPLPAAALIAATAAFYFGGKKTFEQAYREALSRYVPLLGVSLLFGVVAAVAYFAVVLLAIAVFLAVAFIYAANQTVGIIVGSIIGVVAGIALLAVLMLAVLAGQLAFVACVVDGANFAVAFTRSIARVFSGKALRRSLVVGLAFFAITVGIVVVAAVGQGVFVAVLNAPLIGVAYAAIVRVVSASFTTAFAVIYYYDLRVRDEGLDLQVAAARISEPEAIAPSA